MMLLLGGLSCEEQKNDRKNNYKLPVGRCRGLIVSLLLSKTENSGVCRMKNIVSREDCKTKLE
jgi:hypothetical protein